MTRKLSISYTLFSTPWSTREKKTDKKGDRQTVHIPFPMEKGDSESREWGRSRISDVHSGRSSAQRYQETEVDNIWEQSGQERNTKKRPRWSKTLAPEQSSHCPSVKLALWSPEVAGSDGRPLAQGSLRTQSCRNAAEVPEWWSVYRMWIRENKGSTQHSHQRALTTEVGSDRCT